MVLADQAVEQLLLGRPADLSQFDGAKVVQGTGDWYWAKIVIHRGEAIDILQTLPDGETDLVFIDADKTNYLAYFHDEKASFISGRSFAASRLFIAGGVPAKRWFRRKYIRFLPPVVYGIGYKNIAQLRSIVIS
jgi:hypothetical protein